MRIEVVFESDIKMLQIKMTSVSCLIYCFDGITGQALQIRKSHFQVLHNMQTQTFHRKPGIRKNNERKKILYLQNEHFHGLTQNEVSTSKSSG